MATFPRPLGRTMLALAIGLCAISSGLAMATEFQAIIGNPQLVGVQSLTTMQRLSDEHYQLSGERVQFALIQKRDESPIEEQSNRVYRELRSSEVTANEHALDDTADKSILLVVYLEERVAHPVIGLSLEGIVDLEDLRGLLEETLIPGIQPPVTTGSMDTALVDTLIKILVMVNSPIVEPTYLMRLQEQGAIHIPQGTEMTPSWVGIYLPLVFGIGLLILIFYGFTGLEQHISRSGVHSHRSIQTALFLLKDFWKTLTQRKDPEFTGVVVHGSW